MKKNYLTFFVALFLFLIFSERVLAHKVNIFAYSEEGRVFSDSYFPDETKIQGGKVEVFDSRGEKLLEGETDTQGAFSFPVPKKDELRLVLTAPMGHKGFFILKAEELKFEELHTHSEEAKQATPEVPEVHNHSEEKVRGKGPVSPPKEKNSLAIIAGLSFIMSFTALILHFTKKNK